jgi:hypothetical protein
VLSDRVRGDEYNFTIEATDALQSVPWAAPLLRAAQVRDLLKAENKPLMFEVRFAFELHRARMIAEYEYPVVFQIWTFSGVCAMLMPSATGE